MRLLILAAAIAGTTICANFATAAVKISFEPTHNMSCTQGICSPTAKAAILNVNDLAGMLSTGATVVKSTAENSDIEIDAALSWASMFGLTLDAYHGIAVRSPVEVAGTSALIVTTNDGGTGGDLQFMRQGHIDFWDVASSLVLDGVECTLVADIAHLASGVAMNANGCFALAKSYDASLDGVYSSAPVPKVFNGTFDGLGNAISSLSILEHSKDANVSTALFAQTGSGAHLADIALLKFNNKGGSFGYLGGLVGINFGSLRHVFVAGQIIANSKAELIGGVAAANSGAIFDASFKGTVSGVQYIGGLVGWNYGNGSVTASSASGKVRHVYRGLSANMALGGLVGDNAGAISNSHSSSLVTSDASDDTVGGLVGENTGTIATSYTSGETSLPQGFGQVGGLVGGNLGTIDQSFTVGAVKGRNSTGAGGLVGENSNGTVRSSYALGPVTAGKGGYVGGLVGDNGQTGHGSIATSYSIGRVRAKSVTTTGGLVGFDHVQDSGVTASYWDLDTSGIDDPARGAGNKANDPGITGYTDAEMKAGVPSGFDNRLWAQSNSINQGYPYLINNPPPN
jgi:hypothetical protein